jgi:hypothetical protein
VAALLMVEDLEQLNSSALAALSRSKCLPSSDFTVENQLSIAALSRQDPKTDALQRGMGSYSLWT